MKKKILVIFLKLSKPLGLFKYIFLMPVILQCQPSLTEADSCIMLKKYTLGQKKLGTLEKNSYVENGKKVSIEYVDYLIKVEDITTVDADSGIYLIKHPDYPYCREVIDTIFDPQNAVLLAKMHQQVRVMIMLEIKNQKRTWKLVPYQW